MKKTLRTALIAVLILSLAAMGGSALAVSDEISPVTLMVYTPYPDGSPAVEMLTEYAALVKDASEDLITLDIHHSGELGDSAAALSSTQSGIIDIACLDTFDLISVYGRARMVNLPYLFDSSEQACQVLNGSIGDELFAGLTDAGLVFLAEADGCMRQLAADCSVKSARDLEGLRVSVPDYGVCKDFWSTVAAVPVTDVAAADVPAAIAADSLDGLDGSPSQLTANKNYTGVQCISKLDYMWMGLTVAINAGTWDSLPLEAQSILREQAAAAADVSLDSAAEENSAAEEELQARGIEFEQEPDTDSIRKLLGGDSYYDRYVDSDWYDQELVAAILKEVR